MVDADTNIHASTSDAPPDTLGLWDAISLVVGIVVGTSIFRSSPMVFANTDGPWHALGAWALGGFLSLVGALCYAELATTYPRIGGDYEYLTRAYGRWAGFLFGWAQLTAIFTASVGTMAYAFGDYGVRLFDIPAHAAVWLAVAAIVGMSALNAVAASAGKWTQNLLTAVKVAGLVGVVLAAVWVGNPTATPEAAAAPSAALPSFGLAMVFVLYAYGGWNDAAFVAAEVRNRRRNLPLAIIGGVAGVTVIYLAVNAAYAWALGINDARTIATPAAEVLQRAAGPLGAKLVSVLVMISALGAINGMVLAGARLFAVLGADHWVLGWLARDWQPGRGVPRAALAAQAAVTLVMVLGVGTQRGQALVDAAFRQVGVDALPWEQYFGGFELLLAATAPVFWALFLATGTALMVLRVRDPLRERPFQAPFYPLTPLLFCATCVYMLSSSLEYAGWLAIAGVAPVLAGLVLYAVTRRR